MAWIQNHEVAIQKSGRVTLHAISDLQLESGSCDRRLVKQAIREIAEDPTGGLSVILGDIEDADRPTTRSRKVQTFGDRIEVLNQEGKIYLTYLDHEVIPMLLPLAKTRNGCIGILAGHHWKRLTNDLNSVQYICQRLSVLSGRKVPYLGQMSSWVWLSFRLRADHVAAKTLIHVQHGVGGGQTLASALNRLEMTSRAFEADLLIRAHDCKLVTAKFDRLYPKSGDEPTLLHRTIGLMNIGSFTRGYALSTGEPEYPEAEMMRPTTLGYGKAHFDIRKSYAHEDLSQNYRADIKLEI
jgi:hypothetical protein